MARNTTKVTAITCTLLSLCFGILPPTRTASSGDCFEVLQCEDFTSSCSNECSGPTGCGFEVRGNFGQELLQSSSQGIEEYTHHGGPTFCYETRVCTESKILTCPEDPGADLCVPDTNESWIAGGATFQFWSGGDECP